jgi:Leucine-rich repeat (LRR) protein
MKKFIIYLLPIFFINSSIVYSEEVITINNDTLYNKNNLKKKINKSFKDNNLDLGIFYSEKLLKISPNDVKTKEMYNIFNEKQKSIKNISINPLCNAFNIKWDSNGYSSSYEAFKNPSNVEKLYIGLDNNSDLNTLPDDLYKLSNLKLLILNQKKLENMKGIGDLKNLEELLLSRTNIKEIPKEIKNLTKLKKLIIANNLLTEIPKEIGDLKNLEELLLSYNNIKEVPKEIKNLTKLKKLVIANNLLTEISKEMLDLKNLEELVLNYTNIKEIPKEIKNLTKLKKLVITNNLLTEIPKEIGDLKNLEELVLSNNAIKEIPKEIKNLAKLKNLVVSTNLLTKMPKEIGDLKNLENLDFSSQISKYINRSFYTVGEKVYLPYEINKLKDLKYLNLSSCLIETLPDNFHLPSLKSLKMTLKNKNISQVEKSLEQISKITSLETLSITLSGDEKIPMSFSNLSSLEELEVSSFSNKKSSNIIDLVKLVSSNNNLRKLSIKSTSLKTFPSELIPMLSELEVLDLSSNNIENIPYNIENLSKLKELNLSDNKLTNIPDSILKLKKLKYLNLYNNNLSSYTKMNIRSTLKFIFIRL